ncbi:hypothetical protein [Streptomyces capoamus]
MPRILRAPSSTGPRSVLLDQVPLEEDAQAHADLEAHRNRDKIVLMP